MNVLFVTWDGGGNTQPTAVMAREMLDRDVSVRVFGPPGEAGERYRDAGIEYLAHRSIAQWAGAEINWSTGPTPEQWRAAKHGLAGDTLAVIKWQPPHAVVVDYMLPDALCGALASGVPTVAFVHTQYERVALGRSSPMYMGGAEDLQNEVAIALGIAPVSRMTELLDRCTRVLVTTPRFIDNPQQATPDNVRYIGPFIEPPGPDEDCELPAGEGPLVVLCMGTTPLDEQASLQNALTATGSLPVRGFVTLGNHLEPDSFQIPGNVTLAPYTRHSAVFPRADVLVTHAGLSSVNTALACGLPMVCIPQGREQPDNAARVVALGAGVSLPRDADAAQIASAINTVLETPRYRECAQRLSAQIAAAQPGDELAGELEALY